MVFEIELHNLHENEEDFVIEEVKEVQVKFDKVISLIKQYWPLYLSHRLLIMYLNDTNQWLYMTKQFKVTLTQQKNKLKILFIYESNEDKQIMQEVQKKLNETKVFCQEVQKIASEPIDVSLFWASPYYGMDSLIRKGTRIKKTRRQEVAINAENFLKNTVKYTYYIDGIIKQLKQSNKNIHLTIDNFKKNCFSNSKNNKRRLSIVYLIAHTEIQEDKEQTLKSKGKKNKRNYDDQHSINISKDIKKSDDIKKSLEKTQLKSNQQYNNLTPCDLQEKQVNFLSKLKKFEVSKNQNQPNSLVKNYFNEEDLIGHLKRSQSIIIEGQNANEGDEGDKQINNFCQNYASQITQSKKKKNTAVTHFLVGQTVEGHSNLIRPQILQKMLEGVQQIQLLILHTSYSDIHVQKFKDKAKNIILINSNPLYTDEGTKFFIDNLFKALMTEKQVDKAYKLAFEETQSKYPNVQCCCYHIHRSKCTSNDNKKATRYHEYHYRCHVDRCSCENRNILKHKIQCSDKKQRMRKDYYNMINEQKQEFFYCCCSREDEKYHSTRRKYLDFVINKQTSILPIQPGLLKDSEKQWIQSFSYHDQLIGNQKLIIQILQYFAVSTKQQKDYKTKQQKDYKRRLFNLYGQKNTGKKYIALFMANLIIRKNYQRYHRYQIIEFSQLITLKQVQPNTFYIIINQQQTSLYKKQQPQQTNQKIYIPPKIRGIIITRFQMKIQNVKMISGPSQPFNMVESLSFIKYRNKFSPQMKKKLKTYLRLTINQNPNLKYYSEHFEIQQIKLALMKSPYDSKGFFLTKESQNFIKCVRQIDFQNIIVIGGALINQISIKQQQQIQKQIQKISKKDQKTLQNLTLKNIKNFYPLLYQDQKIINQVANFCCELLKKFIKRTLSPNPGSDFLRLYEATTINKQSYLSYCSQRIFTKQIKGCDISIFKGLQLKSCLQSGLQFLSNCLCKHTIFMRLVQKTEGEINNRNNLLFVFQNISEKFKLLILGVLLINNAIIYLKTKVQVEKSNIINQQEVYPQSKLINLKLLSRKGLEYLLQRILNHFPYNDKRQQHLKIVIKTLILQLKMEDRYECQSLGENSKNTQVNEMILGLLKKSKMISSPDTELGINSLKFDLLIYRILLLTNCGRRQLTKEHLNILNDEDGDGTNSYPSLKPKKSNCNENVEDPIFIGRNKVLLTICEDKKKFYQIIQKIKFNSKNQGNFKELEIYEKIIHFIHELKKCEPLHNPTFCYQILIQIHQKISDKEAFLENSNSTYIFRLYQELQQKLNDHLTKITKKIFIWMESNPNWNKTSKNLLPYRQIIKNQIIQNFNKQSETKRKMIAIKMKFNKANLITLSNRKGCRFLCLRIDLNPDNNSQFIGEEDQKIQFLEVKQSLQLIARIPVINLFLCISLSKEQRIKFIQQLIKLPKSPINIITFEFENNIMGKPFEEWQRIIMEERTIMMEVTRKIIHKMHFERLSIDQAYQKTIASLNFINQKGQNILPRNYLQKIVILNDYDKLNRCIKEQLTLPIKIQQKNCFKHKDLNKIQVILANNKNTVEVESLDKFINGLIQYIKIKRKYNEYKKIDFTRIMDQKKAFAIMKQQDMFNFYQTVQKGFILFIHTNYMQYAQDWERKEFKQLLQDRNGDLTIKSITIKITYKGNSKSQLVLCFFDRN